MIVNEKIPKLRFREFSGDLKTLQFDDYLKSISSGKSSSRNVSKNKYLFYGSTGVIGHTDNAEYVGKKILIARVGANAGSIYCANGQYAVSDNTLVVELQPGINTDFIFYYLKKYNLKRMVFGSGQPLVTGGQIKKILITLPNKEEQQKIAEFLTSVDERIELQDKKVKLLQKYKKGIMQNIFNQQIRFKDENGKNYPDWQEKKLGEIGKTYNGLVGKAGEDFGEGEPFITYKQIFDNQIIDSKKFAYVRINKNEKQNTVKYGDIFFTTSSETPLEVGFASVLLENIPQLYLNSFCFGYRIEEQELFIPQFAIYLFRSLYFRRLAVKLAQGSTRFNMSKLELMKVSINLPIEEEQQKIAEFLTSIDDKIELEKSKLKQTKQFKKALLQKMFV